jgi:hypothetical protein
LSLTRFKAILSKNLNHFGMDYSPNNDSYSLTTLTSPIFLSRYFIRITTVWKPTIGIWNGSDSSYTSIASYSLPLSEAWMLGNLVYS